MTIKELIRSGQLTRAREHLVSEIRKSPGNSTARTHLFQVLLFSGEWDKALNHLETIEMQSGHGDPGFQVYKALITAEKIRRSVYNLDHSPRFWPAAPPYADLYLKTLKEIIRAKDSKAASLNETLESLRPKQPCVINGNAFPDFANTDTILTHVMEAFEFDTYYWIPLDSIREIVIEPPKSLLDMLWARALITTWDDLVTSCCIPALYPDSPFHSDDRIRMGTVTDWQPLGTVASRGLGQQVFQAGAIDFGLLEIRTAVFHKPPEKTGDKTNV